jgi:hypothetical protein
MTQDEVASIGGKIDTLEAKLTKFINQYECDMRGDKKINGQKGIVNELRDIKKYHKDYPSILWLLKNKTGTTILTISGLGLLIYFIGMVVFIAFGPTAVVEAFLNLLGIPIL